MVDRIRKGLVLVLTLACALVLVACGGGNNAAGGGEASAPAGPATPPPLTLEEQELFNENGIVLRCMGGSLEQDRYYLNFEVENVDAPYSEVVVEGVAFNGLYLPCISTMSFADKGETGDPDVEVPASVVQLAGITSIDNITILFSCHDDDYNYIAEALPVDVAVASASGDGSYAIAASDDVIFDGEGVTVSYQASEVDEDGAFHGYFLMDNASDKGCSLGELGDAKVTGGVGDALYVTFMSPTIPAGSSALVELYGIDYDSESSDFDSMELVAMVESDDGAIKIPLTLTRSGDDLTVEAGDPVYPEGYGKDSSAGQSSAATETGTDPADAKDLEVVTAGFYARESGSTFGICAIENPNEDLWAYSMDIVYTFYDKAGNELGSETQEGVYLEPNYALPFISHVCQLDEPPASVEARVENAKFDANRLGLYRHNDKMDVTDAKISVDSGAISTTNFTGTLVNDGEAAEFAYIYLLLLDENMVPVYGHQFQVNAVPANGSIDIEEQLGYDFELPEYETLSVDILTR